MSEMQLKKEKKICPKCGAEMTKMPVGTQCKSGKCKIEYKWVCSSCGLIK